MDKIRLSNGSVYKLMYPSGRQSGKTLIGSGISLYCQWKLYDDEQQDKIREMLKSRGQL